MPLLFLVFYSDYGYHKKDDLCILQCFDAKELRRVRQELQSDLFLVQLIEFPEEALLLKEFADYADGIGPWYKQILKEKEQGNYQFSHLVDEAHQYGMVVHPYTFRADQLDEFRSFEEMADVLLYQAGADGAFTDFPDQLKTLVHP